MTPSLVLLASLLAPRGIQQHRSLEAVGVLRHLQLLEVDDLDAGHLRFATSFHLEDGDDETGGVAVIDTDGFEVEASMRVPYRLVPHFSWTSRRPWALLELSGGSVLVALDVDVHRLRIYDFPAGVERGAVTGVLAIFDARVVNGGGEVLLARGNGVETLRLDAGGSIAQRTRIPATLDLAAACAYVRGGEELSEVLVVGWSEGHLSGTLVGLDDRTPGPLFPLADFTKAEGGQLRCAAARCSEGYSVAAGQPGYRNGVGRIVMATVDDAGAIRMRFKGRPDPESSSRDGTGSSDQCEYGQALVFVNDETGDGWPELVVSGPWGFDRVDLLSGADGTLLARFTKFELLRHGYGLCPTPDNRHVLIGGGRVSYPENLDSAGGAILLGVATMTPVRRWERPSLRVRK